MLRFKSLRVENGLSYRSVTVPLEKQGLVLIDGTNGSGKSSLPELLTFVGYATNSKRQRANAVLNIYHPTDYRGRLSFERSGHSYEVDQFRSHATLGTGIKFDDDEGNLNIKTGRSENQDTQALVAEKMGMSLDEFFGSVYLSQKYTHAIVQGTPTEKQKYIMQYFGLQRFDSAIASVGERATIAASTSTVDTYDAAIDQIVEELSQMNNLDVLKTTVTTLTSRIATLAADHAKYTKQDVDLRVAEEQYKEYAASLQYLLESGFDYDLDTAKQQEQDTNRKLAGLENTIEDYHKHSAATSALEGIAVHSEMDVAEARSLVISLSQQRSDLEHDGPLLAELATKSSQLTDVPEWADEDETLLTKQQTKLTKLGINSSKLRGEIQELERLGDTCPQCLRPVEPADKASWLTERQQFLELCTKQITKVETMVGHLGTAKAKATALVSLQTEIVNLRKQLRAAPEDPGSLQAGADLDQALDQVRTELKQQRGIISASEKRRALLSDCPQIDTHFDLAAAQEEIVELKTHSGLLQGYITHKSKTANARTYDAAEHKRVQRFLEGLTTNLEAARSSLAKAEHEMTSSVRLNDKLVSLNKQREAAVASQVRHKVLETLKLSLKDLRKLKLHDATKMLTQIMPTYLNQLFPQETVKVDVHPDSCELIFEKNGHAIPLKSMSGGQGNKVGLAVLFSFTRLAHKQSNLLICDEPYGSLDVPSKAACYDILQDLLAPQDGKPPALDTILVISHDEDLKARRYDQRWKIGYDGQTSQLLIDGVVSS